MSTTSEVSDVVFLLTSDEDVTDGKWTVVANATPIKTGHDLVSFEFDKLLRGKSVHALFMYTTIHDTVDTVSCWLILS